MSVNREGRSVRVDSGSVRGDLIGSLGLYEAYWDNRQGMASRGSSWSKGMEM